MQDYKTSLLFAILQKYDFSSKSQRLYSSSVKNACCLRYCKSTIFQANHNKQKVLKYIDKVVCDTAKVRFFKQITTWTVGLTSKRRCLRYCKSTIFQANHNTNFSDISELGVVCDTAKVRFFKQITTTRKKCYWMSLLFAILQKYDFSSKSQLVFVRYFGHQGCLRYCKSTIFQANHNADESAVRERVVVCDTAKVRFFKQITTGFPIQLGTGVVVCDTAKVRFFKQITTLDCMFMASTCCLRYCKSTIFQANHNTNLYSGLPIFVVCDTAKVRFFKQITTIEQLKINPHWLFAILQKYDFSSKSQHFICLI